MKKIHAVYPELSNKRLLESGATAEDLAADDSVMSILDTITQVTAADSEQLLHQVNRYIDSKDKTSSTRDQDTTMEFWPLVKVVKVFAKSPVLETGLVLADLVRNPKSPRI